MKCDLPSYVSSVGFSDDKNLPSGKREKKENGFEISQMWKIAKKKKIKIK